VEEEDGALYGGGAGALEVDVVTGATGVEEVVGALYGGGAGVVEELV
jgi:hypothetical protein